MKWEYRCYRWTHPEGAELLGRLGREGWELVAVVAVRYGRETECDDSRDYYFKRPIAIASRRPVPQAREA